MTNHINDKRIGVYLDHAKAHIIDLTKDPKIIETIDGKGESHQRIQGESGNVTHLGNNRTTNNENHTHNREQNTIHEYYKVLANTLKNYDAILLFGPTTAKDELYNILTADKHFEHKSIHVESADHITDNQMVAQVKAHFEKKLA